MPLTQLDTGGIARSLAQIADRSGDHVDVFFEMLAEAAVCGSAGALEASTRVEAGLAVRLLREGQSWLVSSDEISSDAFADAVARVARARPGAVARPPKVHANSALRPGSVADLEKFVAGVEEAIKNQHAAFPVRWDVRRHHRVSRVVGAMLSPSQQEEHFFSCEAATSWGRWGSLLVALDDPNIEGVATSLTTMFRARKAPSLEAGRQRLVLGPSATAVLLHEAVAHALETDTLALSGDPEAAVGVGMAVDGVEVVDDPPGAPETIARTIDDEGMPAVRRWLLRGGRVEQPLADLLRGVGSQRLVPGAARRGSRHLTPVPRSTHLELLAGELSPRELVRQCEEGLYIEEITGGQLDPFSGAVRLTFASGRRISGGEKGDVVGKGCLKATTAEFLGAIEAIGVDGRVAGAGWCAKGGHRLPVWATAPSVLLGSTEVGK